MCPENRIPSPVDSFACESIRALASARVTDVAGSHGGASLSLAEVRFSRQKGNINICEMNE